MGKKQKEQDGGTKYQVVVGISGASGAIYGIRLLEVFRSMGHVETTLIASNAAKLTISHETGRSLAAITALADHSLSNSDIAARVSSGSHHIDAMIIAPCSMKTLSGIVHSYSDNLLMRAADVMLKERRTLILVPRESPLHAGHCKLIYQAAKLGAIIAPPMPAFYNHPKSVDDIVDHSVGRIIDLLRLDSGIVKRWKGLGQNSD